MGWLFLLINFLPERGWCNASPALHLRPFLPAAFQPTANQPKASVVLKMV